MDDNTFKYGFLTPFGLIPTDKDYKKDLVNIDRFLSHFTANENFICSMFDYDGLPDSIDERYIEEYLTSNGSIAFVNPHDINDTYPDELIVIRGGRSGDIGNYGLGKNYIGTNNNPQIGTITAEVGVNCVVGYNNKVMAPDFDCAFYADTLKEIEKSILFNIRFARLAPILKASDAVKKEALEQLLNNIDDGNMVNIVTSNMLEELLKNDDSGSYEPIHLTDVDDNRYIQYLIKAYEDLLRIFHTKYGQAEQGSGKLAQQSVDEVNGSASASFVIALDKLAQREKMIAEVNKMFNKNITVKFSPAWDMEYQRYINRVGADVSIEGSEDTSELESELESENRGEDESEEGGGENE